MFKNKKFGIMLIIIFAFFINACDDGSNTLCSHTFGNWLQTISATCATEGSQERICLKCGEKETGIIPIDPTAHIWEWYEIITQATCESDGEAIGKYCMLCGEIDDSDTTIPALGHLWGDWQISIYPTEQKDGVEIGVCILCGQTNTRPITYETYQAYISGLTFELIDENAAYRVTGYTGNSNIVVIPAIYDNKPVKEISDRAFMWNNNITSITIPPSVETIGERAFMWNNFTSITIPPSVKTIGIGAFSECSDLSTIIFAEDSLLESIGSFAFSGCVNLTDITIPFGVTFIGDGAFGNCERLVNITIPTSITTFGTGERYVAGVFQNCTSLTSIEIPNSVTNIGYGTFSGCTSLKNVIIPEGTTILDATFWGCTSLTDIVIPNSVTTLEYGAFRNCTSLTNVVIPNVTTIGNMAFSNCISLTNIPISSSVTAIGEEAFYGCISLTNVIIPEGVKSIAREAFRNCTNLVTVTLPASATSVGDMVFDNNNSLISIIVDDGHPSLSSDAEGILFNKNKTRLLVFPPGKTGSYTVPPNVTTIYFRAFAGSSLTNLTIPASVTYIDDVAFIGWTSAQTINIQGKANQLEADIAWASLWRSNCNANIIYSTGQSLFNPQDLIGIWTKQTYNVGTLILIFDGTNWTLALLGFDGDMYGTYSFDIDNNTPKLIITEDGQNYSFLISADETNMVLTSMNVYLDWTHSLNGHWIKSEGIPTSLIGTWAIAPEQTIGNFTGFVITDTEYIKYTNGTPETPLDLFINDGVISVITSICGEYYFTYGKANYSLNGNEMTLSNSTNIIGTKFENRIYYKIE